LLMDFTGWTKLFLQSQEAAYKFKK